MWIRIRGKKLFFEEATIRAYATRFADLMEREQSLLPAEREELLRLVELSKQPIHSLQPETSWNDMEWCRYIFAVVSGKEWPTKAYYPKTR